MGIIIDLIIVAIIALNTYFCYKKGLVKLAVGLIAVIVAMALSVLLYKPVSNLIIEKTQFDENIESAIIEKFASDVPEGATVGYTGPLSFLETEIGNIVNNTKNQVVYSTAGFMAEKFINLIVFIVIFTVVRVALFALTFLADAITSLPIIKQLNGFGGILYGLIEALLIIYAVLAVLKIIAIFPGNSIIGNTISSSFITKFFYENNLLLKLIF